MCEGFSFLGTLYFLNFSVSWKIPKVRIGKTSLVVQLLRRCASTAGVKDSIPGQGTEIPHAVQCSQKVKKKRILKRGGGRDRQYVHLVLVLIIFLQKMTHFIPRCYSSWDVFCFKAW